jgi:Leucine-rich repeat (LRR) protein
MAHWNKQYGMGWRGICVAAAFLILLSALTACGAPPLDPTAEEIVITNPSQLENQSFAEFSALRLLDLRAIPADAARVDELRASLPNCEILWNVPLGNKRFDSASSELVLPASCTAEDLALLHYFPLLERVDARACAVDAAFAKAAFAFADVSFVWDASIGGVSTTSGSTTLDLTGSTIPAEQVLWLLKGLPVLTEVVCNDTIWSAAELTALREAYPAISFLREIEVFGERVPADAQALDFSDRAVDPDELSQILEQLPAIKTLDLTGQTMTLSEMERLTAAFPAIAFNFSFEVFGKELTTDTTELDLEGYVLSSPEEIAKVLTFLPNLNTCDLSHSGLSNEQMEQLMAQFPSVKFIWVIRLGAWEIRTDITAFSKGNRTRFPDGMGYFTGVGKTNFYDEDIQVLKYCKDLVYLDLGHGNRITDLSVLTQLKHLRVLIVSMNKLVDLSPIAQMQELELLEIYQNPFTDISPVAKLPKLKYLNCNSTLMTDASPLFTMQNLEMLWFVSVRNVSPEQKKQLVEALPNCRVNFRPNSKGPGGWKGNPLYEEYQAAFGLPLSN